MQTGSVLSAAPNNEDSDDYDAEFRKITLTDDVLKALNAIDAAQPALVERTRLNDPQGEYWRQPFDRDYVYSLAYVLSLVPAQGDPANTRRASPSIQPRSTGTTETRKNQLENAAQNTESREISLFLFAPEPITDDALIKCPSLRTKLRF